MRVWLGSARLRDDGRAMRGGARQRVPAADRRGREHRVRLLRALGSGEQIGGRGGLERNPARLQIGVEGYGHQCGRRGRRPALGERWGDG